MLDHFLLKFTERGQGSGEEGEEEAAYLSIKVNQTLCLGLIQLASRKEKHAHMSKVRNTTVRNDPQKGTEMLV